MPTTPSPAKSRRRLAAWLAFGAAGLACGAVWATGFASIGGATGSDVASTFVAPSDPAAHALTLKDAVTPGSALTVDWNGRWGSTANTNFFTVDLSNEDSGNTYNVAFLLANAPDISKSGWSSLQLNVEQTTAAAGSCAAASFNGTKNPEVMAFDSNDAGVYWNALPGGDVYCIGVDAADGDDPDGTFLRRDSDTAGPTVYPRFLATVDRAS